jgi:hypothetical protein
MDLVFLILLKIQYYDVNNIYEFIILKTMVFDY